MSVARCCCPGETTIVFPIQTINAYDEEQSVAASEMGQNNVDIGSPFGIYRCNCTWRIASFTVAQGTTLISAILKEKSALTFQINSQGSTTPPNDGSAFLRLRWSCEDSDNAPVYTTPANYETRARTGANTTTADAWASPPSTVGGGQIDITSAVQAVLNRVGFASGNALAVIADENGSDNQGEGTPTFWGVTMQGSQFDLEVKF